MASLDKARKEPQHQLFEELEDIHAGMLGVEGSGQHMQPMAPMVDRANGIIWFFTGKSNDITKAVEAGSKGHFCVIGKDHDYHACLTGPISTSDDQEVIDRFWNSVVAAWYENGKDDPELVLLKLELESASIWASTDSSIKFGWEIAKANMGNSEPEVGVRNHITFSRAA